MDRPSQTLLRLDLETHAYHTDADHAWLRLLQPFITRDHYADQLARAYAFEAPLEAALAYTPHVASLVGVRHRARLLEADLFALDYPLGKQPPKLKLIAPFPSVCEALGWLYVAERTARLYEMVLRNVRARLSDVPAAYLDDRAAPVRWTALGEVLDRVAARSARIGDQIIHAAHDAFRCQLDWYVDALSDDAVRRGA